MFWWVLGDWKWYQTSSNRSMVVYQDFKSRLEKIRISTPVMQCPTPNVDKSSMKNFSLFVPFCLLFFSPLKIRWQAKRDVTKRDVRPSPIYKLRMYDHRLLTLWYDEALKAMTSRPPRHVIQFLRSGDLMYQLFCYTQEVRNMWVYGPWMIICINIKLSDKRSTSRSNIKWFWVIFIAKKWIKQNYQFRSIYTIYPLSSSPAL